MQHIEKLTANYQAELKKARYTKKSFYQKAKIVKNLYEAYPQAIKRRFTKLQQGIEMGIFNKGSFELDFISPTLLRLTINNQAEN